MDKRQDDYLSLKSYEGHDKLSDHQDFSTFEKDGEHYFAMHDKAGNVVLRSEGYSSENGRDNGIQSVIKNRDVEGRYSIDEVMKKFFVILKAGNHQEIARSGAYATLAEAEAFISGKPASGSQKVAAAAMATGAVVTGKTRILEGAEAKAALANGKIINEIRTDKGTNRVLGERKLVKENRKDLGEKSRKVISETRNVVSETRNQINEDRVVSKSGIAIAAAALAGPAIFKLTNKAEFTPKPLPTAAPFVPDPVVAAKIPWWPLLLLLLPLLLFLWPVAAVAVPGAIAAVAPPPPPVIAVAPVCDCASLNRKDDAFDVFKLPKKPPTKIIKRLGTWPEFGNSHALDAAGFHNKLKNRYATNAVDKKFLDEVFTNMGFDGFNGASASDFSEVTLKSGVVGNLGGGPPHRTYYSKLVPTDKKDLEAFRITAKNGCHLHFMKTCGNHMFTKPCPADEAE